MPNKLPCFMATMVLVSAVCVSAQRPDPVRYPPVLRDATVDDYHGTRVADPYRWLEATDSPATARFIADENAVTRPYLDALPGLAAIRTRLQQLYRYERFGVPTRAGNRYFFTRNDGQQDQASLMVSDSASDPGRVLIDPGKLRADATVALASYYPSPDGKYLAYALSEAGSDWKTWHIRDVTTGVDLKEVLHDTKFTPASWARDGSGFYYSAYPGGDDKKQAVVRWHRLGDAQSADKEIYAVRDHDTRIPYGEVSEDGRYLVITLDNGTLSNGIVAMDLRSGASEPVFVKYDGIYAYLGSRAGVGTELLFRTTAGAPNGRIVAADMGKPEAQRHRVVVPESANAIEFATLVGDKVMASYIKDARTSLQLFDAGSARALGEVALPGPGSIGAITGKPGDSESFYSFTSFSTPTQTWRMDMASGATTLLRQPKYAADTSVYVTEQVFYKSKDGTRVPMFIVHHRDFKRDATGPVLLYGYGGFDISLAPWFSSTAVAWLEMGGAFAVANLRGGGEYGAEWHKAGTRDRKQNVFDDFIAAAEYLVSERYAAPKRVAILGESNGGLLVGAVITQRPELFGAALPDVGVLDMLRYHLASANARQWSDDYGLSEDAADFRAQLAYSPLQNAGRQSCYPPTLVTTAAQDNRVVPWHSFKFAAALQNAQKCPNPVLLRVETRAGHGAGKPVWMQIEHTADQLAFVAAALDMPVSVQR